MRDVVRAIRALLLIGVCLGIGACGKGPDNTVPTPPECEGFFPRGVWVGNNYSHDFRVEFKSDCSGTVSYPSNNSAKFTWVKPANGFIELKVSETTGSGFLPQNVGSQSIPYAYQETNGVVSLVVKFDASNNFNLTLERE